MPLVYILDDPALLTIAIWNQDPAVKALAVSAYTVVESVSPIIPVPLKLT